MHSKNLIITFSLMTILMSIIMSLQPLRTIENISRRKLIVMDVTKINKSLSEQM